MPAISRIDSSSSFQAPPKRSFSLTNLVRDLVDRVYEQKRPSGAGNDVRGFPRTWSKDDFATIGDDDGERRCCPYSAVVKNPSVPYEFVMPLHYPRFNKQQYESMPEWQLDRLLEEYGLPAAAMGSLDEKREYAMGAFLWKDQMN